MKKLFRFHRGSLAESLDTTIEVSGFADLQTEIIKHFEGKVSNIKISKYPHRDLIQPTEWGDVYYYVVAHYNGYRDYLVGECNFYEK